MRGKVTCTETHYSIPYCEVSDIGSDLGDDPAGVDAYTPLGVGDDAQGFEYILYNSQSVKCRV
jgi:hypothetical protein